MFFFLFLILSTVFNQRLKYNNYQLQIQLHKKYYKLET